MNYRAAFALIAALTLSACGLNSVPTAEENAKAKWADVENYYQRRADLIPNLVATVKAAGRAGKEHPGRGDAGALPPRRRSRFHPTS